ncbi:glycogen debranching protein, partial [Candidatus Sumerlaeota bacterium]|nr:glycogen debranching protein [Candidatus Sumerlaeota bacterium]
LSTNTASLETKEAVNLFYWISLENWQKILQLDRQEAFKQAQVSELYSVITGHLQNYPFYLPYVALTEYGLECDVVGNLLAIFFGIADRVKTKKILDYLDQCGAGSPFPVAVLDEPIHISDPRWSSWFAKAHLNLPYQYHNGGIWPFVGGLYVATLVKVGRIDEAQLYLERLAEGCRQGKTREWEFNEWLHKLTGRPMGSPEQLWSAAMYCFAYQSVQQKHIGVFQDWR